eukprot:TRINITY_DN2855_c0_g2_i1.p1 TRINITY_DN2855_c0_g2~~TRINITY_DN2855_c0_g2_i1.p1  ORF type:complete len:195 (+),score=89.37 TRINITY_DN2855_c0_g2_i1:115-699(+)
MSAEEDKRQAGDDDGDDGAVEDNEDNSIPDVVLSDAYKTLEEDEEALFKVRAKLYRFEKNGNEWRERGMGEAKLLKHKQTGKVRLLMRREKTYKICANHYIMPYLKLQENKSSDKSWIWSCPADFAEEKPTEEVFAIRFANVDDATNFKKHFEEAQAHMKTLAGAAPAAAAPAAAATEEKKAEEPKKEEEKKAE